VDTPTHYLTFKSALLSFGGALKAGEIVEKRKKIFVLSRPPGHHAHRDFSHGFCFFNNIAGLAMSLYENNYKPLIIDWDAHHGDGTQSILYKKPITYISLHQKFLFPNTGKENEIGEEEGYGYNFNFPLPTGCDDEQFISVFLKVEDIIKEKKPDIILVSAGQDGHKNDPYSGLNLSSNLYKTLGKLVSIWANKYTEGRLILLLEGGYNLEILAICNANICEGILETENSIK
jgi:acetoin utilization deacetylase AcuC-like enzyme